ncbi:MAG TPA: glycosyl hydrolase family 28 protein [Verrucomicrobiae bacterium]|nr:glycosyl hydrolase family 28 protein [Verrucomicrobiae bacterium]
MKLNPHHPRRAVLSALAGILVATASASAVTPWTLFINTNNVANITNYNANVTNSDNASAIQAAINAAAAGGIVNGLRGGTVEIPAGTFLSGPITLKANVNLQVDDGAILRMLDYNNYPGGITNPPNFISGTSLTNIAISGPGAIDGQGAPWWPGYKTNSRPRMIALSNCRYEMIQNITLSNSPMFHIAISGNSAANTTVQNVTVLAPDSSANPPSHNTDACDVDGTNVLVQFCHISTGDDNFTCGGGTYNVLIISNNYGNGHGVSIGSYTDGGVSDMEVSHCNFDGTQNGVRLKSDNDRGGFVHNIFYHDLGMTNVHIPIQAYAYYNEVGTPSGVTPYYAATQQVDAVTSLTPIYRDIIYSNITATTSSGYPAALIWARREMPATNIVFKNVDISATRPFEVYNSQVIVSDCTITQTQNSNTFSLYNADLTVSNSTAVPDLLILDGLTTNGYDNAFSFYNANASLQNTNCFDNGPLTLGAGSFVFSNNLTLFPNTVMNYFLGSSAATATVKGNLVLGGTNNIFAGPGFGPGTYLLMTNSGSVSGFLPILGTKPGGYAYALTTNATQLLLTVSSTTVPPAPTNLVAAAGDSSVALTWSSVAAANTYNVKRSTVSGGSYATIATGIASPAYTDSPLTNGVTCYYVVSSVNGIGESTNSAEVSATPQASASGVVTTNVLLDLFTNSSLNSLTPAAPTATNASYQIISSKSWSPTPSLGAGPLKFGIGGTSSGSIEVEALFAAAPVVLDTIGDSLSLTVTFTNTAGILTQTNALGFGLYNSGGTGPVPGGLPGTATSSSTTYANGYAQMWAGYVGQVCFTNTGSQIMTRPAQTVGTLANNDQDVLTSGSGSSSYNYPAGATVGSASSADSVILSAGNPYTDVLTITLTAANTLAITNSLYAGADTNAPRVSQVGGVASGSMYFTNSFDALGIGWRAQNSTATAIDINKIAVSSTLTTAITNPPSVPPAPTNLAAVATNLAINLSWNAVTGATTYNLKRGTVSGTYPVVHSGLSATTYADTDVTNTVSYFYVVSAVNANGESTNSIEAGAAPLPSSQPTNVAVQLSGNQLVLTWPQDHIGWRLQIQTNNLASGLGTNWTDVPAATTTNQVPVPINPTNGSVFLRMVYP